MKKKIIAITIIFGLTGLSGCVESVKLDKDQERQFVEYSVYSVLEHDKNYMIGLNKVDIETEENTKQEEETSKQPEQSTSGQGQSGQKPSGDSQTQQTSNMNEALGIDGATVSFTGVYVGESFPEVGSEPSFVIKAVTGKKLVVLKYDITNTSGSDMKLDLSSKKISFKGIFNGSVKTNVLVTLLPEALNTYDNTIPAGQTKQAVLVFELSQKNADNLSSINVEVRSDSGVKNVKIQ